MLTATALLSFDVTEVEITSGLRHHPEKCPVALAIQNQGYSAVSVYADHISFLDPETDIFYSVATPDNLSQYIQQVDRCGWIAPETFCLSLD